MAQFDIKIIAECDLVQFFLNLIIVSSLSSFLKCISNNIMMVSCLSPYVKLGSPLALLGLPRNNNIGLVLEKESSLSAVQ
jgi:hypothetical protein